MEVTVDERLEFLTALVVAYKEKVSKNKDDFDWVEYPHNDYVRSLIERINIANYPEIAPFLESGFDCGWYSQLYFYFDFEMNYDGNYPSNMPIFGKLPIEDYGKLVHKIYVERNLKEYFLLHEKDKQNLISYVKSIMFSKEEVTSAMDKLYGIPIPNNHIVVSLLFNGGFGPSYKGESYYLRGIEIQDGKYFHEQDQFVKKFFHEASHPLVNPLIDKYSKDFKFDDALLKEAIDKGLPSCYTNLHTLLCEYFVRANENYLTKKYISEEIYWDSIAWLKTAGFIYIEELIAVLEKTRPFYNTYEEVLVHELLPYLEKMNIKLKNNPNRK